MTSLQRRTFLAGIGAVGAASAVAARLGAPALAQGKPRVVVIGGGFGGATVAHYIKREAPAIEVTLVEPKHAYVTCMFSNLYLGGIRTLDSITHDYSGLKRMGVRIVSDVALSFDPQKKTVACKTAGTLPYDRLVISPGISFNYASVPGYSAEAAEIMPHAWQGGPQTSLMHRQLEAMPDGGVVLIAPPAGHYRCPPAPYERACLIAGYLKKHKPKSKLILLDPKKQFVKQALFEQAFSGLYKDVIELRKSNDIDSFAIQSVDPKTMQVKAHGETFKAAVANIIPAQRAGDIALKSGLAEGDWCPVDPASFLSRKVKDVYVIGDAADAGPMPKSGFAANSQAKLVVNDIASKLAGAKKYPPRLRNTCWSALGQANTVKIGAAYTVKNGKIAVVNGFQSGVDESPNDRARNTGEYLAWYVNITTDAFAK